MICLPKSSNFLAVLSGRFAPHVRKKNPQRGSQILAAVGAIPPSQSSDGRTSSEEEEGGGRREGEKGREIQRREKEKQREGKKRRESKHDNLIIMYQLLYSLISLSASPPFLLPFPSSSQENLSPSFLSSLLPPSLLPLYPLPAFPFLVSSALF